MTGVNRYGERLVKFLSNGKLFEWGTERIVNKSRISSIFSLIFLLLSLPWLAEGNTPVDLFSIVSAGDPAYTELIELADAGWLSAKDVTPTSLTRFDVAQLIQKAEKASGELIVAQAAATPGVSDQEDMLLPAQETTAGPATSAGPATLTPADRAQARLKAAKALHSLEEAYRYELQELKDKVKALRAKASDLESQQYDLRKRLKGITQYPTIAVHGYGLGLGYTQQYSGDESGLKLLNPGTRYTYGFLDLQPEGTVSKEVRWSVIFRVASNFLPTTTDFTFSVCRITLEFNPSWLSATFGDFDEAYTPFTLWNRNTLDLKYVPEMWARWDSRAKYENFFDNEPYWPFRGLRLGEALMWPDSDLLESLKVSGFIHMIRNGFNDNGGWYYGSGQYTDWIFGGTAGLKSPQWYLGSRTLQLSVDTYGLILDESLDTELPGAPYDPLNPLTWAHQYLTGSVKPDVKVGLGDDCYAGGTAEYAYSRYQDDKRDPDRMIGDYAVMAGPYLQFSDSRVSVNYLNVGPYYYSPLAQTRQDAANAGTTLSPDLYEPVLRSQYFLTNVPNPGAIFGYYDRTQDNTFPYGLATPNREGFGLDADLKVLKKDSLKIKGSAYWVKEITGNMVINTLGTGYVPVDSPANTYLVPVRNFTYINVGPSFNLGPYLGLDRDLELGTNLRYERTTSDLGTLNSAWIIGGIRVDLLPVWEISAAFSQQNAKGTEAGLGGTLWARYPYLYDYSDLGNYSPVQVDGNIQSLRFSNVFKVNRNSDIFIDYDWTSGNMLPTKPVQGTLVNQFIELSYEVRF